MRSSHKFGLLNWLPADQLEEIFFRLLDVRPIARNGVKFHVNEGASVLVCVFCATPTAITIATGVGNLYLNSLPSSLHPNMFVFVIFVLTVGREE